MDMVMYSVNRCPKENDCDVINVMPAIALSIISKENTDSTATEKGHVPTTT